MKKLSTTVATVLLIASSLTAQKSRSFVHNSDSAKLHTTKIDNAEINGNNNYFLLSTHNYKVGTRPGTYNDNKTSVYYYNDNWYLYNENFSTMDTNLSFNVFIPGSDAKSWAHEATNENIKDNYTFIDHPSINEDSNAVFFVTSNWNPGGVELGVYNTNLIGVFYRYAERKWCIYHEDKNIDMIKGSSYNVVIPTKFGDIERYVHTSDGNNITNNRTEIDHPDANGNPDAQIFITHNYNPGGATGKYHNKNVGVWYNGSKWTIYNEDKSGMPIGVSFNVMIMSEKTNSVKKYTMNDQVLHVFPNPAESGSNLDVTINEEINGKLKVEIMDMTGKVLSTSNVEKLDPVMTESIDINSLASGIYILRVHNSNAIATQRFVIE
jgi:hypothetical protein